MDAIEMNGWLGFGRDAAAQDMFSSEGDDLREDLRAFFADSLEMLSPDDQEQALDQAAKGYEYQDKIDRTKAEKKAERDGWV